MVAAITSAGGRAIGINAYVSTSDGASRIAEQTVDAFGGIDILVNNAAIELYGTVVEMCRKISGTRSCPLI